MGILKINSDPIYNMSSGGTSSSKENNSPIFPDVPLIEGQPSNDAIKYNPKLQTKEECIKRQGTIQAAMQSQGVVAFAQNYEDYKRLVKDLAEFAIAFVENK